MSRLSALAPEALSSLARSLGGDGRVVGLARFSGGLECETYTFGVAGRRLVMKRFPTDDSAAAAEFENLSIASAITVPTPEPVLLDEAGSWFGTPTLVMSALAGSPAFDASDQAGSARGAAIALAAIHDLDPRLARSVVTARWRRWRPDTAGLGKQATRASRALDRLQEIAASDATVFSHDDYNPGNVLCHNGCVTGVIDWAQVTIEPRQAAVALYRHMLAIHPGGDEPERFLAAYETATGATLEHMPLWDLFYGLRALRPIDHWVRALHGHGVMLTAEQITSRSIAWIEQALIADEDRTHT